MCMYVYVVYLTVSLRIPQNPYHYWRLTWSGLVWSGLVWSGPDQTRPQNPNDDDDDNDDNDDDDDNDDEDDYSRFRVFGHNSVNFHARTSRFCMEVDLDNF